MVRVNRLSSPPAAHVQPAMEGTTTRNPQAVTVRVTLNGTMPGIEAALRVLRAGIVDEGYQARRRGCPA
jgi:hypothetical protein